MSDTLPVARPPATPDRQWTGHVTDTATWTWTTTIELDFAARKMEAPQRVEFTTIHTDDGGTR